MKICSSDGSITWNRITRNWRIAVSQQFLRVGPGLEPQFGVIAVVIQRIDQRIAGQARDPSPS